MKNIFKSRIFLVILTAFICITGTVYASELFASSISFTPSNPDWELEENTVEAAINDLYLRSNLTNFLDSNSTTFGGQGVSFEGFRVGHKYLAIFASNFWSYDPNLQYSAHINHGADNVIVLTGGCDVSERVSGAGSSCAYLLTFTATDTTVSLSYGEEYGGQPKNYSMRFVEI